MISQKLKPKIPSLLLFSFVLMMMLSVFTPSRVQAQDPSGTKVGNVNDIPAAKPGKPTQAEVYDTVGHNKIAINIVWTLITGFLVMFMQVGFAMVETGFTQKKNAAHTMAMNFLIYALGVFGFWICGFAFMFGGGLNVASLGNAPGVISHEYVVHLFGHDFGLWGYAGYFLNSKVYDVGIFTLFLFQVVFMDTAATIPTGAMADRWKFTAFIVYGLFISMFVYPLFGNWVWGGGWLSNLGTNFGLGHGHVDFAGSSVVHQVGGVAALVGAWVLGPRIGKYGKDGKVNTILGHNIPMAVVGTFILAFGWFGFNPGSTLAGTDLRIGVVATNTMLASIAGALGVLVYQYVTEHRKIDIGMLCNGLLSGLVAITAPCAFVNSACAVLIGFLSGIICVTTAYFVERKLKIDDPVGAFAVHGANGSWGVLALGLFADGTYGDGWNGVKGTVTGLFYGDYKQFIAELIGTTTCFIFVGAAMYIFFIIVKNTMGIRVSEAVEIAGMDVHEVGVPAYVD